MGFFFHFFYTLQCQICLYTDDTEYIDILKNYVVISGSAVKILG